MTLALTALESADLKLRRAAEHLQVIKQEIWQYCKRKPYKIIEEPNGEKTLHIIENVPENIAIVAGEVVYQLRSTLDYLTFDLVKLNRVGNPLPANWREKCCFPLFVKISQKTPVIYNFFERQLPNISKSAFAFIESVQPYHGKGTANALKLLANLSNVDKHRHFNVTLTKVAHDETVTTSQGGVISVRHGGLKHGSKIETRVPAQPYPVKDMKRSYIPYVTFDEPTVGDAATLEVEHVLQVCLEQIQTVIVPAFARLLK
jgi:hypothetical protein